LTGERLAGAARDQQQRRSQRTKSFCDSAFETQLLQARKAGTDACSASLSAAATLAFATGAPGSAPEP